MRKEILNWWKQSLSDLEKAKILFKNNSYDGSTFFSHQAVEKALKAYILLASKEKNTEGHSLIFLSRLAKLPSSFENGIRELNPHYTLSRYPDMTEDVPY